MNLQTKSICSHCFRMNDVGINDVAQEKFKTEKGDVLYLTNFKCKVCGEKNFVQVDSDYTKSLLKDFASLLGKAASSGCDAKELKKLRKKKDELTKELKNVRAKLALMASNSVLTSESGEKIEVKVGDLSNESV